MKKIFDVLLTFFKKHDMIIVFKNNCFMEEMNMKAKGLRLVANLVLCIGVVACLLGLVISLLISNGLIFGLEPTDYVPQMMDFIILGIALAVIVLAFIVLQIVANVKAKRERIAACWAEAEAAAILAEALEAEEAMNALAEEAALEEPVVEDEEAVEEVEEEAVEVEEVVEELPLTKGQIVRQKIVENTPITEKQLETATKVGKIAIPVATTCLVIAAATKIGISCQKASNRQKFYKWLG